jgi:hypothetical protein
MKYAEIKSEFIKRKIRETSWIEHEKIDELICLFKYIRQPPMQYNSGWHFSYLKSHYEEEYLELLHEFSSEAYQSALEEFEKKKKKNSEREELAKKEETKLKQEWLKAGGQP